jgi:hypothetical protein
MYLQSYESGRGHVVNQVGCRNAVNPDFDGRAESFYPVFVPAFKMVGLATGLIVAQVIEPTPPCLIIDSARPEPFRPVFYFHLVSVHTSILIKRITVAADLHP